MTGRGPFALRLAAVAGLALFGCKPSMEKEFPPAENFCARDRRIVPDIEKMVNAQYVLLNSQRLARANYAGHKEKTDYLPLNELEKYISADKVRQTDERSIVRKYIENNKYCCQIIRPDYLEGRLEIHSKGDYFVREYPGLKQWGYYADIFIFNDGEAPFNLDGYLRESDWGMGVTLRLSNCGDVKRYSVE